MFMVMYLLKYWFWIILTQKSYRMQLSCILVVLGTLGKSWEKTNSNPQEQRKLRKKENYMKTDLNMETI